MNEGYEAYKKYLSIKLHFTKDEYDFFKYNGEINAKYETFIQRNDRYFFVKAARKYGDNITNYFVSNFISNKSPYIKDMNNDVYLERQKRIDGLAYYFERDIEQLLRKSDKNFDKKTRYNIGELSGTYFKKTIKHYLFSQVRTSFLNITADEMAIGIFLPVARFIKGSPY